MLRPIHVWTDSRGLPIHFIWRDLLYSGRIVNGWRLQDRWWNDARFSDRASYRLITRDDQAFDLFRPAAWEGSCILIGTRD